jgi:tRNA-splicing ligase RtcB
MSRQQALRRWSGRTVVDELAARGIVIRTPSQRGVAEEAPGAYKNVDAVGDAADAAGLARKVARRYDPARALPDLYRKCVLRTG